MVENDTDLNSTVTSSIFESDYKMEDIFENLTTIDGNITLPSNIDTLIVTNVTNATVSSYSSNTNTTNNSSKITGKVIISL